MEVNHGIPQQLWRDNVERLRRGFASKWPSSQSSQPRSKKRSFQPDPQLERSLLHLSQKKVPHELCDVPTETQNCTHKKPTSTQPEDNTFCTPDRGRAPAVLSPASSVGCPGSSGAHCKCHRWGLGVSLTARPAVRSVNCGYGSHVPSAQALRVESRHDHKPSSMLVRASSAANPGIPSESEETTIGTKFSVLQIIRIPSLMRCGF